MSLKRKVESLDVVEEHDRGHYVQIDPSNAEAGFRLNVDGDDEAIVTLRQSLENERGEHRQTRDSIKSLKSKLEGFGDFTPDKISELQQLVDSQGDVSEKIKDATTSVKTQLQSAYEKELQARDTALSTMSIKLENTIKRSEALDAIAAQDGRPKFLLHDVLEHMEVVEDGDRFTHRMVDDKGTPLVSRKQGIDSYMQAEEYIELLKAKDEWTPAFNARVGSGGGASASGGNGGAGSLLAKPVDQMTREEKVAFIEKHGEAKWLEKLNNEQPTGQLGKYFKVHTDVRT